MKVAILLGEISIGGGQTMVLNLVKHLENCELLVVSIGKKQSNMLCQELESICNVEYISGNHFSIMYSLQKILLKFKPDVVHSHLTANRYAALWAIINRKSIISTMHTIPQKAYTTKVEKLIRFLLKNNRCICVAVSNENYSLAVEYFNDTKNIVYINNGISIEHYYRNAKESDTVFINVARQDENKNQKLIIEAFQQYHNAINCNSRLILAGDGPKHNDLIDLANKLGISGCVEFTGFVDDSAAYLARADVYIQSSHREGLPMSVLEAMAAGIPIISTNVGGMQDIIKENGILIDDGDCAAMVNAMSQIDINSEKYQKMCRLSKKIVEGFSAKTMANKYYSIYKKQSGSSNN